MIKISQCPCDHCFRTVFILFCSTLLSPTSSNSDTLRRDLRWTYSGWDMSAYVIGHRATDLSWYFLYKTTGMMNAGCRCHRMTQRKPRCCSSGSSTCSCKTSAPSPATSTSPWTSTTMIAVRYTTCNVWASVKNLVFDLHGDHIWACSCFKVTPAEYQPPGFKEGECDRLWFEGVPVHFKVGEVQTAFHTLRVRITAEKGRMEQLTGNHLKETEQDSEREMMNVGTYRGAVCRCHFLKMF